MFDNQIARTFISIHAPRTGSDIKKGEYEFDFDISIHAPRTGSDCSRCRFFARYWHFNPRSPHGERLPALRLFQSITVFQSTLPARGATWLCDLLLHVVPFQSTLPARGATFSVSIVAVLVEFQSTLPARGATADLCCGFIRHAISIHAPRTGSDSLPQMPMGSSMPFQSTLPARGATFKQV